MVVFTLSFCYYSKIEQVSTLFCHKLKCYVASFREILRILRSVVEHT